MSMSASSSLSASAPVSSFLSYEDAPLASLGDRLAGALIDGLLTALVAIPGLLMMFPANNEEAGTIFMVVGLFGLAIYQWSMIASSGQTIGKRWAGTRIVGLNDELPGFGAGVVLRLWIPSMISAVPYLGGLFSLLDILFIFGDDRRCLHDRIAGTKVVRAD